MQKYIGNVVNNQGTVIPGALISVFNAGTNTLSTIYLDNGVTTQVNPITADALAFFAFYAANGLYDLVFSGAGVTTQKITNVQLQDSSGFTGTVTSVSVVSVNGLAGSVATPTVTPAITLSVTFSGIAKGNGTALSAATSGTDYAPGTSGLATGLLKSTTGTGNLTIAAAGSDYSAGTSGLATGMLKSTTGTGALTIGASGTDYSAGTSGLATGILKSTTATGALTIAVAGDFPTLNQNTTGTASNITGNLAVANLNSGTGASNTTFWRGDGVWASPAGSGDMVLASVQTVTGAKTFGTIGGAVGKFILAGSTSGSSTLDAAAVAGSTAFTLPSTSDTLIGKATTDTLTNKTYDTAGTGNSFKINGTAITAVNGSGAVSLTTSPAFVTPSLGVATATSINKFTFTAPATAATINTRADNLTHSLPAASGNLALEQLQQNSQSAAYTTVLSDAGKQIYHPGADTTARTWTIDSNANVAYPIGTALTFINDTSAGVVTIAITADTMILAGAGTTGSRTLAANGIATAIKMTSTRWIINGTGLT